MKFTIDNPKQFKEILDLVVAATDGKDFGNLSYVLIKSNDGVLEMFGTNLDLSVKQVFEADIQVEGSICVKAKKFLNIIKNLTEKVTIKKEANDWVSITTKGSKFRLAGTSDEQFPTMPEIGDIDVTVQTSTLSKMIKATAFAVTNEETRFALYGVKFTVEDGVAKMVATDGHRISYIEDEAVGEIDVLLPKNCLNHLTKLADGEVEISSTVNHLFFRQGETVISARKTVGTFPAYESVVDFATDKTAKVNSEDFKNSFKRVIVMADDKVNALKMSFKDSELVMSTVTAEMGEGEDSIAVDYDNVDCVVSINSTYLADFITSYGEKEIEIFFTDGSSPVKFGRAEGNYKYVVMPLRTV